MGIEASEKMRQYCKKNIDPSIEISAQDISNFHFDKSFDTIALPLNIFNHLLSQDEQIACLNCCRAALSKDGKVVIDIFNPTCWAPWPEFKEVRQFEHEGQIWQRLERHEMSEDQKLFILELKYINQSTQDVLELGAPIKIVKIEELLALLNHCGFEVENVFGSYDKSDFEAASHHIIVTAKH